MEMQKFIRRSVEVKAIQFDIRKAEDDCFKYYPMIQDMYELTSREVPAHKAGERFYLKDNYHSSVIHDGDYIVHGNNGQFYVVDNGDFELGYQPVDPRHSGFNKFPNLSLSKKEAEAATMILNGDVKQ